MKKLLLGFFTAGALFFVSSVAGRAGTEMAPTAPPPSDNQSGYWVPSPAPPAYYYPPAYTYYAPPPPYYYYPPPYYGAYYGPGVGVYGPGLFFGFGYHGGFHGRR